MPTLSQVRPSVKSLSGPSGVSFRYLCNLLLWVIKCTSVIMEWRNTYVFPLATGKSQVIRGPPHIRFRVLSGYRL